MSENQTVPFTTLVLIGKGEEIKMEKSLNEVLKMMTDPSPFILFTDVKEMHYALPKSAIKIIKSDDKQND